MNMRSTAMKRQAAAAAYGSLRAEGLRPSQKTQRHASRYISGKMTKRELKAVVIREVKQKNSR